MPVDNSENKTFENHLAFQLIDVYHLLLTKPQKYECNLLTIFQMLQTMVSNVLQTFCKH